MTYGYSHNLVEANKNADSESLGVAFGRMCIELGIPATHVAVELGVSRMTVYNWFWGERTPSRENSEQIKLLMARYKNQK
jgi:hypothetical protein